MGAVARWLLKTGAVLLAAGVALLSIARFRWPGHLPGDLSLSTRRSRFVLPFGTTALIGIVLAVYFNLPRFRK